MEWIDEWWWMWCFGFCADWGGGEGNHPLSPAIGQFLKFFCGFLQGSLFLTSLRHPSDRSSQQARSQKARICRKLFIAYNCSIIINTYLRSKAQVQNPKSSQMIVDNNMKLGKFQSIWNKIGIKWSRLQYHEFVKHCFTLLQQ